MTTVKQPGSGKSQTREPPNIPTPEDPCEHQPVRDPPVHPDHDPDEGETRLLHARYMIGLLRQQSTASKY